MNFILYLCVCVCVSEVAREKKKSFAVMNLKKKKDSVKAELKNIEHQEEEEDVKK